MERNQGSKPKIKCTEDIAGRFDKRDIQTSKVCAALSYLFFFVPIIVYPDYRFGRYHANQALILALLITIGATLLSFVPYVGLYLAVALVLFVIACSVRGMVLALRGRAKHIPVFGNLELIVFEPKA
ncbi:MAG: hypothetical protein LBN26_01505 [Christensenellaceae bacterium]|jgi:uncharacterized membrane protein|nr:hypothetical protein [Christensenellaceae bacterium]